MDIDFFFLNQLTTTTTKKTPIFSLGDSHQNLSFIPFLQMKIGSTEHALLLHGTNLQSLVGASPFRQVGTLHFASIPTTPYCGLKPTLLLPDPFRNLSLWPQQITLKGGRTDESYLI